MIDHLHHVPGRLRLTSERFRKQRRACNEILTDVGAIDGIVSASANPVTGSLIIRYERARLSAERLWQTLTERDIVCGPSPFAEGVLVTRMALAAPTPSNPEGQLFATLSGIVLDKLMARSAAYLVAALV